MKHTSHNVQVVVSALESRINILTFEPEPDASELPMNGIGQIKLRASRPIVFDGYAANRMTGSFILIEPGTNATVAAGMLLPPRETVKSENGDYVI
jgi:bifunctional enzyme CysN/CysC/sulfate adenylyltransferase subunit 1